MTAIGGWRARQRLDGDRRRDRQAGLVGGLARLAEPLVAHRHEQAEEDPEVAKRPSQAPYSRLRVGDRRRHLERSRRAQHLDQNHDRHGDREQRRERLDRDPEPRAPERARRSPRRRARAGRARREGRRDREDLPRAPGGDRARARVEPLDRTARTEVDPGPLQAPPGQEQRHQQHDAGDADDPLPRSEPLQPHRRGSLVADRPSRRVDGLGARRAHRVDEQHRARHRAHAAGHRRDRRRLRADGLEVDVADEAVADAVGADVDHHRALGDHVGGDRVRPPDRGHDHVGLAADRAEVARARVAVGDRRVGRQQQRRDRLADEDRPADHRHPRPLQLDSGVRQQLHHPRRRARHERLLAVVRQQSGVGRRQPIDVLGAVDRLDQRVLVEMAGQRQLQQDAVDPLVGVQRRDQLRQLLLRHVAARLVMERLDPDLRAVLALHPHVDRRRRIPTDQDRREPRRHASRAQLLDLARHPLAHPGRDRLPVDDLRCHQSPFRFSGA